MPDIKFIPADSDAFSVTYRDGDAKDAHYKGDLVVVFEEEGITVTWPCFGIVPSLDSGIFRKYALQHAEKLRDKLLRKPVTFDRLLDVITAASLKYGGAPKSIRVTKRCPLGEVLTCVSDDGPERSPWLEVNPEDWADAIETYKKSSTGPTWFHGVTLWGVRVIIE